MRGKKIRFHIDNQAVVYSLKFRKIKDKILQSIVRTIWLLSASYDIQLHYSHIPSILNKEADALQEFLSSQVTTVFSYCIIVFAGL